MKIRYDIQVQGQLNIVKTNPVPRRMKGNRTIPQIWKIMTGCKMVEAGESNGEAGQRENFARNTLGSARGGGMGMVIGITLGRLFR